MTNNPYTSERDMKGRTAEQAGEVKDHALQEATDVKDHATGAARDVAQTAGTEAKAVARDARREFRGLVDDGLNELNTQLGTGQNRLASELREVVTELGEMVQGSQHSGYATQAARELSDRGERLVGWLDTHEPRDALNEVRRYAARNPWTFLALAAGAGLLVGRLARGLRDDSANDEPYPGYDSRRGYTREPAVGLGYAEPPAGSSWSPQIAGDPQPYGADPAGAGVGRAPALRAPRPVTPACPTPGPIGRGLPGSPMKPNSGSASSGIRVNVDD